MNEKIDLTKILKNCPIGWKFYSSVYGDVEFVEIYRKPVLCNPRPREDEWLGQDIHDYEYPIRFWAKNGNEHSVSSRGEMIKGCGECTFFPSSDQRDWSKFTAPWYKKERFDPNTLKPYDRVLVFESNRPWAPLMFSYLEYSLNYPRMQCFDFVARKVIPYNKETEHLLGTYNEAPEYYIYWEE